MAVIGLIIMDKKMGSYDWPAWARFYLVEIEIEVGVSGLLPPPRTHGIQKRDLFWEGRLTNKITLLPIKYNSIKKPKSCLTAKPAQVQDFWVMVSSLNKF